MIGEQWRGACVRHVGPVCATSEIPLAHAFIRFSEPFSSFASGKQFHGHANHTSVSDVDDRGLFFVHVSGRKKVCLHIVKHTCCLCQDFQQVTNRQKSCSQSGRISKAFFSISILILACLRRGRRSAFGNDRYQSRPPDDGITTPRREKPLKRVRELTMKRALVHWGFWHLTERYLS